VGIGGSGAEKNEVEGGGRDGLGGLKVEEVAGSVKALSPVASLKGSLEQQGVHDIVGGTNHALSLAVGTCKDTTFESGHREKGRRCEWRSCQTYVHCRTGHFGWYNQTAWTYKQKSESVGNVSDL
jgi:hypothetical protein